MREMTRREAIGAAAAAAMAVGLPQVRAQGEGPAVKRGRLKQSVSRWCYGRIPLPEFCGAAKEMGLAGIDLVEMKDWPVVRDHGLVVSTGTVGAGSIPDGVNRKENHDRIVKALEENLPLAARAGVVNLITFFGNRRGMADEEAIENSVACLQRVKTIAEDHRVTVLVELLNSKIDHKDYIGDRTRYGARIVRAVGSPRVKLLYDIYHMQIMEGDVIRTIREHRDLIGHFHTGGVPGRGDIDDTQELNYAAIARAIADLGFTGYLAHEFVPREKDPLRSLRNAAALCDV